MEKDMNLTAPHDIVRSRELGDVGHVDGDER